MWVLLTFTIESADSSSSAGAGGDHSKDDQNLPKVPLCESDEVEINEILNNHRLMDEEMTQAQNQVQYTTYTVHVHSERERV